jgi:Family of unknown function (DUF5908)
MTMTIEIKQLIIRAVVEDRRARPAGTGGPESQAAPGPLHHAALPGLAVNRETLIADCARQVVRALQRGRGR